MNVQVCITTTRQRMVDLAKIDRLPMLSAKSAIVTTLSYVSAHTGIVYHRTQSHRLAFANASQCNLLSFMKYSETNKHPTHEPYLPRNSGTLSTRSDTGGTQRNRDSGRVPWQWGNLQSEQRCCTVAASSFQETLFVRKGHKTCG